MTRLRQGYGATGVTSKTGVRFAFSLNRFRNADFRSAKGDDYRGFSCVTRVRGQIPVPGMATASGGCTMIKSTLSFLAISALLAATSAFAKTVKLPGDEFPIASITFPDDWTPEDVNNGVAGESPDS